MSERGGLSVAYTGRDRAALTGWVAARGSWPGPLFVRLDRAAGPGRPTRLDAGNVARVSHALGRLAGVARGTNPHHLRRRGISRAMDLAGGDARRVRRFSRHAKLETLMRYDDNRRDEGGHRPPPGRGSRLSTAGRRGRGPAESAGGLPHASDALLGRA